MNDKDKMNTDDVNDVAIVYCPGQGIFTKSVLKKLRYI